MCNSRHRYTTAYVLKSLRMFRPRTLQSAFSQRSPSSTLEELLYQPNADTWAQGEGLVHLHAWENHNGGDPSAAMHVLGASPSVSYGPSSLLCEPFSRVIFCRCRRSALAFCVG